jgi:UDP-N-acetylmuramoylalanine--D-glutamate ligase
MRQELNGKAVLVVGLARSGLAAIDLLLTNGARVQATDERPITRELRVPLLPQTEATFTGVDLIVLSPAYPSIYHPSRQPAQREFRLSARLNWRVTF